MKPPKHRYNAAVRLALTTLLLAGSSAVAVAQASVGENRALAVHAGTLGLGAELTHTVSPRFALRLGANTFERQERRQIDDIEYDADVRLRNALLLLDLHPAAGAFRLSAGAVWNDNGADGTARLAPGTVYEIGDIEYPGALIGEVDGELTFDEIAPYAGLGWGARGDDTGRRWFFVADLGVIYQGEPEVELRSNLPALSPINLVPALRQQFERELDKEEAKARQDAAQYDIYPVVQIGVAWRF